MVLSHTEVTVKFNNKKRRVVLCPMVFVLYADIGVCCDAKRADGGGVPPTETVLLQHRRSQRYLAIDDQRVVCIPLQRDDARCTFECKVTMSS